MSGIDMAQLAADQELELFIFELRQPHSGDDQRIWFSQADCHERHAQVLAHEYRGHGYAQRSCARLDDAKNFWQLFFMNVDACAEQTRACHGCVGKSDDNEYPDRSSGQLFVQRESDETDCYRREH